MAQKTSPLLCNLLFSVSITSKKKKKYTQLCNTTHYTSLRYGTPGNTFHAVELKKTPNVMWMNSRGLTHTKVFIFFFCTLVVC